MESVKYFKFENSFKGKNIIITGITGGIGSRVAEALIMLGANIIGVCKKEKKFIDKFAPYVKIKSHSLDYEVANFDNPSQIAKAFKSIMLKFKGRLDSLIMCHGQFRAGKMMETGVDIFDTAISVNVRACFHWMSLASPFLKLSKGNVVALSSVDARIPVRDSFVNSVSKSMLNSLIECSALELAPFGVRVNGVAPAITNTNFRVSEVFNEKENMEYLDKMGIYFLLNKEVFFKNFISKLDY
jgi:NAD(P)-dependent dehydrogenase (short-subunit alcohol dehydrogenase family)